jgi:hypothetical protein
MVALQLRSLLVEEYQRQAHSLCCVALLALAPGWQAHAPALLQEALKAFPAKVGGGRRLPGRPQLCRVTDAAHC